MPRLTVICGIATLLSFTACTEPAFTPVDDGREMLGDGNYNLVLTSASGHGECQNHFPEGRLQAFSVQNGVVSQERSPFIRVRARDIAIRGDNFRATFQGPFIVQSKVAMQFDGHRIENGYQGGYTASTGFDSCRGNFQLTRVSSRQ